MTKIYTLNRNSQGYDMDMWGHWLDTDIIGYYKTKEGALQAIIDILKDIPYKTNLIWNTKLGDARNILKYSNQCNGEGPYKKVNLYHIGSININE
jgi:hypothetical protein